MNERERAEQLARTIDGLIHGSRQPAPLNFEDNELQSLINVARARLEAGRDAAKAGTTSEANVWARLAPALEGVPKSRLKAGHDIPADDDMRDTVAARRVMSDSILALADLHKDEVWRRIQERVQKRRRPRGRIPPPPTGGVSGRSDSPLRTRHFPTPGVDTNPAATARPILRYVNLHQRRLTDHLRSETARKLAVELAPAQRASHGQWWQGAALAGALVLAIAAIAPVPGLSEPPGVEAARYAGEHLGVVETDVRPPASTPGAVLTPEVETPKLAAARLGLPVSAPDTFLGLPQTSSLFFAAGLTSSGSGVYVLTYQAADASTGVTIYQEAEGQGSLAVPSGSANNASVNGSPASYFEGSWSNAGGTLTWQESGTQTVVFERDGLRTTVQYTGPEVDMAGMIAAVAMLPAPSW